VSSELELELLEETLLEEEPIDEVPLAEALPEESLDEVLLAGSQAPMKRAPTTNKARLLDFLMNFLSLFFY
jgi:hypothetical protein